MDEREMKCPECGFEIVSETALNSAAQERPLNTNGGRATGHIGQPSECLTARGEAPRVPARAECDDKEHADTPRTNALWAEQDKDGLHDIDEVWDHARQLERELAIAKNRLLIELEAPTTIGTQSAELALTQADEDAIASGQGRPATLAEALSILKAIHKLSPAEQRDIDEAISCIVAFDGITDEMVERAMDAAGPVTINFRPPFHEDEKTVVREMLEAVIEGMKPMRSKSAHSATGRLSLDREQVKCIADELHAFARKVGPSGCGAAVSIGALLDAWLVSAIPDSGISKSNG